MALRLYMPNRPVQCKDCGSSINQGNYAASYNVPTTSGENRIRVAVKWQCEKCYTKSLPLHLRKQAF